MSIKKRLEVERLKLDQQNTVLEDIEESRRFQ